MGSPYNPFDSGAATNVGGPGPGGQPNQGGYGAFGAATSGSAAPLTIGKPPAGLLAIGAGIAVLGVVLAAVFWGSEVALLGWLLAGPVAIGVLAFYAARDTARRAEPVYLRPDWLSMAYAAVAALVVIGIVVSSLSVAFWAGQL